MKGKQIVNFFAYIAIALIAVALILSRLFAGLEISATVVNVFNLIAQIIAYAITAVFAFYFAKAKKSIGWMVAYIIFVICIIVFTCLNFGMAL